MNILIEGDSWAYVITDSGQGTFWNDDQEIKHTVNKAFVTEPFIKNLLISLDHEVTLNAKPGSSNEDIVKRLAAHDKTNYDLIIVFQTTPCRKFNVQRPQLMTKTDIKNLRSLGKLSPKDFDYHIQTWLEEFYIDLHNVITTRYNNTPTLLIGGCSSIEDDTFNSFLLKVNEQTPLVVMFNSVIEYLSNVKLMEDLTPYEFKHHSEITFTSIDTYIDKEWNSELIDYIYETEKHRIDYVPLRYFTWPDGRHLNRDAHFYIVDEILFWAEQNIESFADYLKTTYP